MSIGILDDDKSPIIPSVTVTVKKNDLDTIVSAYVMLITYIDLCARDNLVPAEFEVKDWQERMELSERLSPSIVKETMKELKADEEYDELGWEWMGISI